MKHSFIILVSIFIFSCIDNTTKTIPKGKENTTQTTYYLIRHAEKDRTNPEDENPKLEEAGLLRAQKWVEIFSEVSLDAVYSSDFKRTMQTATPIAEGKNIKITTYDPHGIYETDFKEVTKGKNILVVGHSNTIPKLVNYLIEEEKYADIEDSVDGNLYIVTVHGNKTWSTFLSLD
jgi:broad specificity phosphatase PhoE